MRHWNTTHEKKNEKFTIKTEKKIKKKIERRKLSIIVQGDNVYQSCNKRKK